MKTEKKVVICPFHTESTPSCVIDHEHLTFHCFGCGEYGDIGKHGELVSAKDEECLA